MLTVKPEAGSGKAGKEPGRGAKWNAIYVSLRACALDIRGDAGEQKCARV